MGKAKTRRQKYHSSAAKANERNASGQSKNSDGMETTEIEMATSREDTASLLDGGIFKNINIDLGKAAKELPDDFDARSTITSKTFKGLNVTKKEKRKMKHDVWMKRVDTIQAARKEVKERKKRQKTAIVGDMKPLEDTLPTLELLLRDTSTQRQNQKEETKPKSAKKNKQRQKDMLNDIKVFQQVLQHPIYQKDFGATITEHLKNKLKQESMDT